MIVEDSISEMTNAMKKKMSKSNATSHTKIKQKFKKFIQATGDDQWLYETQLAKYRENPQDSEKAEESEEEKKEEEEEEEDEEEDEDEEDADAKAALKGAKAEAAKEGGDDDDDDEYDYYDPE